MSERGVFAVDRGIWEHPVFRDQPFTDREAWMWLVGEASFKARTRNVSGKLVELDRGQLAASVRYMAERWQWSKSAVDRFLARLKTGTMIETDSGTGILVITICNYDNYQRVALPVGTQSEPRSGTAAGQQRDKTESTESTEVVTVANATGADAPRPVYTDSRHELWGEGVPILVSMGVKERDARSNIGRWLKTVRDDAQAVLGAIQRARDHRVHGPIPWITNALKAAPQHDNRTGENRTNTRPRSATDREADFVARMGGAMLSQLEKGRAAGRDGPPAGNAGAASSDDADPGAEGRHWPAFRVVG